MPTCSKNKQKKSLGLPFHINSCKIKENMKIWETAE